MYKIYVALSILVLFSACQSDTTKPTETQVSAPKTSEKQLRHVVLFKFKDGVPRDTISAIEQAFVGLKSQISIIKAFEWGPNNSPEQLNQGFTHCFVVTFATEADRDAYLPHPMHQAFVEKWAKPYVDKVCVFDFWADPLN
jgi:hypothetical protein